MALMRNNFLQCDWVVQDQDSAHALPISQMGNYQEYLKRQTPQLRELESAPVRQHMFGNPFKIDKRMMVDEADIDFGSSSPGGTNRAAKRANNSGMDASARIPSKRKPGPLPRDLIVRRPSMDITPPASPVHSPLPSPIPWLYPERVPPLEEPPPIVVNHITTNGIDTVAHVEPPRPPSPTMIPLLPFNITPPESVANSTPARVFPPTPEHNDYFNFTQDDKQISQILKEANNTVNNNNVQNNINNGIATNEIKQEIKVNFLERFLMIKII